MTARALPDGVDPRQVRTAYVLKDGALAATLTRTDGAVEFAYETAYLEAAGRAVATTLPLTDVSVRTGLARCRRSSPTSCPRGAG